MSSSAANVPLPGATVIPTAPYPPSASARISTSIFDNTIDMQSRHGAKLYETGAAQLPSVFSGNPRDLSYFINSLRHHPTHL